MKQPNSPVHPSFFIILSSPSRRFWITMALCAAIYAPSLFWALGLDQNIFAEIGWLLLHGKLLYVHAWDVKPPNVFYVYALFERLFGPCAFAARASDYVFAMLACAAIYMATAREAPNISRAHSAWVPPLAALLLAGTLLSLGLADTAQTESYSLAFIITASLLVQSPRTRGTIHASGFPLFIAGILLGIAAFFKTSNAVFLTAIAAEVWLYHRARRKRALILLLAGFATWSLAQIAVLAARGSLEQYVHILAGVIPFHSMGSSRVSILAIPRAIWTYLDIWSIFPLCAIGIAIRQRRRAFFRAVISPAILLISGIVGVLIQRKGWGYQYVIILPGLVPLCALCAVYIYDYIRLRSARIASLATAITLFATIFITPSAHRRIRYSRDAIRSITHHGAYLASLGRKQSLYYPPNTDTLANYINHHTLPSDKIFIFGEEPGAYWRARREPDTRFVYSLLFASGVIPPADLRAMQDTIIRTKPALISIERYDTTTFHGRAETSQSLLETDTLYRPLKEWIAKSYPQCDTVCGEFIVYRR